MKKLILTTLLLSSFIAKAQSSLKKSVCQQNPEACFGQEKRNSQQNQPSNNPNFDQIYQQKEDLAVQRNLIVTACSLSGTSCSLDNDIKDVNIISITYGGTQDFEFSDPRYSKVYQSFPFMLVKFTRHFPQLTLTCISKVPYSLYTSSTTGRQLIKPFREIYSRDIPDPHRVLNAGQCL